MMENGKKEYSVEEAAQLLEIRPRTVRFFLEQGVLLTAKPKTEPAEDDFFGRNVDWILTEKDIELLRENLAKHAREKILCETGRCNEVYGGEYSDFVKEMSRRMKEKKGW